MNEVLDFFKDETAALSFVLIYTKGEQQERLLGVNNLKNKSPKEIHDWYNNKLAMIPTGDPVSSVAAFHLKTIYRGLLAH